MKASIKFYRYLKLKTGIKKLSFSNEKNLRIPNVSSPFIDVARPLAIAENHIITSASEYLIIKLACYREVDHFINLLRNRPDRRGTVVESIDFTDYKALPMDPINCFEHEQTDYSKYDELVGSLQLSALELAILNCYMNGMVQSEVCAELGIGRGKINSRKASIRQRYYSLYGAL